MVLGYICAVLSAHLDGILLVYSFLEFQQMQWEQPLELPLKPPQTRNWRCSTMAPFGGNNMLFLCSCPPDSSSPHFVQILHNEHPISMPVRNKEPGIPELPCYFFPFSCSPYLLSLMMLPSVTRVVVATDFCPFEVFNVRVLTIITFCLSYREHPHRVSSSHFLRTW